MKQLFALALSALLIILGFCYFYGITLAEFANGML